jgi:hypothetical protein
MRVAAARYAQSSDHRTHATRTAAHGPLLPSRVRRFMFFVTEVEAPTRVR